MENYTKKMEQQLLEVIAQKEASDKQVLRLGVVMLVLSSILYLVFILIPHILAPEYKWLTLISFFLALLTLSFDLLFMRLDQRVGYFQCKHCSHIYTPTYFSIVWAWGGLRKKHMRCPKCQKKSWHKRVYTKNEKTSE